MPRSRDERREYCAVPSLQDARQRRISLGLARSPREQHVRQRGRHRERDEDKVIFARSFARIHEANLKKQGVLALTFADPASYDLIGEDDRISVIDLHELAPDRPVRCVVHGADGTTTELTATHTMNDEQIEWFRAGSALNIIRRKHTS
jgi:hypothetical protein